MSARAAEMSARDAFAELKRVGLEPLLAASREKIVREDGVRGRVVVLLGRSEQQELAHLLGRPARGGEAVQVDLRAFDAALQTSRFRVGLAEALAAGYGPLVTRRQVREQAGLQWQSWTQRLQSEIPTLAGGWFERVVAGASASGRWVRRAYGADPVRAATAVRSVGQALAALPVAGGESELLAVFAAAVTGDPHAFDAGEPAGMLLEHALGERFERAAEGLRPNEARALLLGRAGLQVDQVSSTVLVAHLESAGLGDMPHPMVAAMTASGGAWAVTLGEVRRWSGVRAHRNRAYVVENPPVFEWLLRRLGGEAPERRATLICSGGFLSAAAVSLLDLLVAEGAELWYGGDFDRNGLAIASWLAGRYPEQFRPWRMGAGEYQVAVARGGKGLAPEDCEALLGVEGPLAETARAVARAGQAGYQEQLVMMLCQDILETLAT